ncbi:MAG: MFS transporter [Kibdelosporangium sp.]
MTTLESPRDSRSPRSAAKGWFAVVAVTLGIFSLMTSELLPVGLLTPVGTDLHVSDGTAGLMVTIPGIVAAVSAPLVTVATGRFDRRLILAILVGIVGLANLASAFADSFTLVLAARFLIGISVGGFWSIAGGIALRLVPENQVNRATAVIFAGVETASVFGVPTGTLIGDAAGWRTAFGAVGVLGLFALVCLVVLMPKVPAQRTITLGELPRLLRGNAGVKAGIVITFLLITGHFLAYTYVQPILTEISRIDASLVSVLLLTFGVAGICGNFLAGWLVGRSVRGTVAGISVLLTAAVTLIGVAGPGLAGAIVLMVLWGLAYGGVPVTLQTWILAAAPAAAEAASSMYVSMFNWAIALGALLGGFAVDGLGTASVLWLGGGLAILTVLVVAATRKNTLFPVD